MILPAPRPLSSTQAEALVTLVNSAYRGEASKKGWTTEADLLGGQRIDLARARELAVATAAGDQAVVLAWTRDPGRLEACVLLERKTGGLAYLGMLSVSPELQNAGWGRVMLEQAEGWVRREWGVDRVEMTVIGVREELIAWYERRGYRRTGERRPFPIGDARFGLPKVNQLEFIVLEKKL